MEGELPHSKSYVNIMALYRTVNLVKGELPDGKSYVNIVALYRIVKLWKGNSRMVNRT